MSELKTPPAENVSRNSWLRRVLFCLRFLEIRLRFIAILLITALLVGYWDHVQNYYDRWQRERHGKTAPTQSTQSDTEYYCGMHPFVVRDRAGKCPICGMDLTPRKKGEAAALPEDVMARVQTSPERVMQAGVTVEPVMYHYLVRSVRSYGVIEPVEGLRAKIVARFPGRIEELLVNSVGATVKKGEPLARIYSPKYLAASDEYLRALSNQKRADELAAKAGALAATNPVAGAPKSDISAESKTTADQFVAAARKRLLLAGFTEDQLNLIAENGASSSSVTLYSPLSGIVLEKMVLQGETVEESTSLYTIADLSVLWVQVKLIEADIADVKPGMAVEVTSVAWPNAIFYGTVDLLYPALNTDSRTVNVRVTVRNPDGKLRPGMYVNALLRAPVGKFGPADAAAPIKKVETAAAFPTTKLEDATRFLTSLAEGATYYMCPMHAEVVSDKPGECALCGGMKLVKEVWKPTTTPSAPAASSPATVVSPTEASSEQWTEGYACIMHPDELSETPGVCRTCNCGMPMTKWRAERVLAVPETAVIDTGTRKVVYVESMPGVYDAHEVQLGARVGVYYPVTAGLKLGDKIVSRGSFLIDAEARLNPTVTQYKK